MSDDLQLQRLIARLVPYLSAWFLRASIWDEPPTAFTPTYEGSTTAGATTYTTQQGAYARLGRVVIAQADITWTAATGTGQVRLGGLPFPVTSGMRFSYAQETSNVTFANGSIEGLLDGAVDKGQLASPATNAGTTELNIEAAGTIRYTMVYFTG
jgi:hypothetical protein